MQPNTLYQRWLAARRWLAAMALMLAAACSVSAQEGIVRISDSSQRPGVVHLGQSQVRPVSGSIPAAATSYRYGGALHGPMPTGNYQAFPQAGYAPQQPNAFANASWSQQQQYSQMPQAGPFQTAAYSNVQAGGFSGCPDGSCNVNSGGYGWNDSGNTCNSCNSCNTCNSCESSDCYYGGGYHERMCRLFAPAEPCDGCTGPCKRWWRGQQNNYLARNQRLSNTLFGWMVPSGCCGQGCPPVGKYCVTYSDNPGYSDPRDNQMAYGAQGYGVPLQVPLAPNVRHTYNYSWGVPSSRITPLGPYSALDPNARLYHQSW